MGYVEGCAVTLAIAMILDALFGEPRWLWSKFPHPAILMGRCVAWIDATFNNGDNRRLRGTVSFGGLCLAAIIIGVLLQNLPFRPVVEVVIVAILLAQRSLADHVSAVGDALRLSLGDGRLMVARIVGRDTRDMDQPAVARAAIESAAENFSDGVAAPIFWFAVGGLPGILLYKMTNTADSMIGYRTAKYEDFGWAAARFDDLMNWIPARLTALIFIAVFGLTTQTSAIIRDSRLHRSPNAGWPESAMARALGVALAGPRSYDGTLQDFPFVHDAGKKDLGPTAVDASVKALWRVWAAILAIVLLVALF